MNVPKKRRTEITIETHQLTIIRHRTSAANFMCPICQIETVSFLPAQAALAFQISEAALQNLISNNLIHSADPDSYCGNSLADHFRKQIR